MAAMVQTRITANDYFDEAMAILAESGFPDVSAVQMCTRLGVSRGSFYHHFTGFDDFLSRFLQYWCEHYSTELVSKSVDGGADGVALRQMDLATGLPHRAEAALGAWATVDPVVAAAQARVDELRYTALVASLRASGLTEERAATCAAIASAMLAGLQVTGRADDPDAARAIFTELAVAFGIGMDAQGS
jgi:AcrR family transcriptional regulator